MPATREDILKSALELSETDRLVLATELMDSVPDELSFRSVDDADFAAELERRANDGSAGIAWESVREQLRADLSQ